MLINRIYYTLKPVLPWSLRLVLRRARAKIKKKRYAAVWPIDEQAGHPPSEWPGWPGGKRFALVLTHDVEGSKGLGRIERLMQLDLAHGFRSACYLVPQGEYRVPDSLRASLERTGAEIAIHGLEHDGKLYDSAQGFDRKAKRINEYLTEWNACGFRSPLMQHRLDWLHKLHVNYDASTFDTDPFEPEPDGTGTVFPFWVPGPNGTGYVELPYSLAQDFTLFVLFRERTIDIWKRKLDWVASHGGMAMLTTHPDYICFDGTPARDEFPVSYYEEFLRYVRQRYDGLFWNALPREVAQYYRTSVLGSGDACNDSTLKINPMKSPIGAA